MYDTPASIAELAIHFNTRIERKCRAKEVGKSVNRVANIGLVGVTAYTTISCVLYEIFSICCMFEVLIEFRISSQILADTKVESYANLTAQRILVAIVRDNRTRDEVFDPWRSQERKKQSSRGHPRVKPWAKYAAFAEMV